MITTNRYLVGEPDLVLSLALHWRRELQRVEHPGSAKLLAWDEVCRRGSGEDEEVDTLHKQEMIGIYNRLQARSVHDDLNVSLTSQFALTQQARPLGIGDDAVVTDAIDPDTYGQGGMRPHFVATLEALWGDAWRAAVLEGERGLPCMWDAKELGCLVHLSGGTCPQMHRDEELERMCNFVDFPRVCARCGVVALSLCSRCRGVFFCGRTCQRSHWPLHRAVCRPGGAAPVSAYVTPVPKQV
jgi:hypothetical protein